MKIPFKLFPILPPQLKDNGAFADLGYADTFGLNGDIYFVLYTGALDIALGSTDDSTPPLLEEADVSDFSDVSDVTGSSLSAVISATDDNKLFVIKYDLRKAHKRYVRPKAPTAGDGEAGDYLCICAIGTEPGMGPQNAAQMGAEELVSA